MELYEDVIETIKKYIVHLSVFMRQECGWIRDVFYRSLGASLFLIVSLEIWIKYGYTFGNSVSWGMYLKSILKKIMQNSLR